MNRYTLLVAGASAAIGVLTASAVPGRWLEAILAAVALLACCIRPGQSEFDRIRAIVALALAAGILSMGLHARAQPRMRARTMRVLCDVVGNASVSSTGVNYPCMLAGGTTLAVYGEGAAPPAGERVLVRGRVGSFDVARNPGEPDEETIQRERGLAGRISGAHVLADEGAAPNTIPVILARMHASALAQLRLRLAEPYASILAGELWGERAALPPELRTEFQQTGTVHILVTAGLHLGIVAAALLTLLRLTTCPRSAACAAAIVGTWAYAIFSGLHLPAERAAAMISIGLAAHACGRAMLSWNAFGAALLFIVITNPAALTSTSFALSFSCVGAILLAAPQIAELVERCAHLPAAACESVALAAATQLGTWPLTLSIFLLVAPYAIVANLVVVPCVGATMLLGAVQLLLAPLPALAQAAANLNGWILAWIVGAVGTIASLPGAVLQPAPPPFWSIPCYDAALIAAVTCARRRAFTPALLCALVGFTLVLAPPVRSDALLHVTVLDVGQADGMVLRTPKGHVILVDAGGRLERGNALGSSAEQVGERTVVPFLRRAGLQHIDAIILSHPHGDHAGGVAPVIRAFGDGRFADSGQRYGGFAYNDAVATARAARIPIVYPRAGDIWRTDDGVTLRFFAPSLPFFAGTGNDINNNSIVFMLEYKRFRMLFTGDAGSQAEARILREGFDLHATILKVGHHGSAYSSTPAFIAAVHPRFAVISVGRHNMFGHPAPSTIATLQRFGARIYRTDQNGAVLIATDGYRESITPMLP